MPQVVGTVDDATEPICIGYTPARFTRSQNAISRVVPHGVLTLLIDDRSEATLGTAHGLDDVGVTVEVYVYFFASECE